MKRVEAWVPGEPVPFPRGRSRMVLPRLGDVAKAMKLPPVAFLAWLRKRCFAQAGFVPAKHPVREWQREVSLRYHQQVGGRPLEGPVTVDLTFYRARPSNKVWKTKPMPREWDVRAKGDLDNLEKGVLDALNKVAWVDDCQVVECRKRKFMCAGEDRPGVLIAVSQPDPSAADQFEYNVPAEQGMPF